MEKIVMKIDSQNNEYIKSKKELIPYPRRMKGSYETTASFSGIFIDIS